MLPNSESILTLASGVIVPQYSLTGGVRSYAVVPQIRPRQPDVLVYLGDDETGRPLEVVAVVLDDGDLLVIHVMDMRQKFRDADIASRDEIGE